MTDGEGGRRYAGDVSPQEAYRALAQGRGALVDVRTHAEWNFVGVPETPQGAGCDAPILLEWQSYPTMAKAQDFAENLARELETRDVSRDDPVFFLCRSGARSAAAATEMNEQGYRNSYNIEGGFEGVPDGDGHRGRVNGWKAAGLPWRQA